MATPPSFWPAPDAAWRLDSDLVAVINTELTKPLHSGISKLERHNLLQKRLADLGAHLGYNSQIEVETGHRKFKRSGRFDVVWTCRGEGLPIIFEIDSCWRHESLLKLGRVGEEALKLWIYYGQRPFPQEPVEPGFRRLNILRIEPWRLGVQDGRRMVSQSPGRWTEALYPRQASSNLPWPHAGRDRTKPTS